MPNLAGAIVMNGGAHRMMCTLKNLLRHEGDLTIVGILNAVINSFEEDINRLCGVDGFIHSFESFFL